MVKKYFFQILTLWVVSSFVIPTRSQPVGDFLAIIGSVGNTRKVVLFNYSDGSLAMDPFIDLTPVTAGTLKHITRVGDELWVSDQTGDKIYRYTLSGNYIGAIGGGTNSGLDNLRGLRQFGSEVWLSNAGNQNGAPGNAVIRLDLQGNITGYFPVGGSPWAFWPYPNNRVLISFSAVSSFLSQIAIYDFNGTYLAPLITPGELNFIQQFMQTPSGQYLVASFSNSTTKPSGIHRYDAQGNYLSIVGGTANGGARGCWELANGNVLWTNANGIHLANVSTGTSQLIYAGGFHYIERLTFLPSSYNIPYSQDFEIWPPLGWSFYNIDNGGEFWKMSTLQNHTQGGNKSALHDYSSLNMEDGWLITPAIALPPSYHIDLSFWSYNTRPANYFKNSVLVSTSNVHPTSGNYVEVWAATSVSASWVQTIVDLSAFAGNTVYIAFRYQGQNAHGWFVDDVLIEGYEIQLPAPQNLSATVNGNNVQLSWQAPPQKNLTSYKIYRNESAIATVPATQTNYLDSGLSPGTHIYAVSAVYTNGESPRSSPVQVLIQGPVGKVHGFVRDAITNQTISQATITASSVENGAISTMTIFGSYYSLLLPPGSYHITCASPGYQSASAQNINVVVNTNVALTFYLQPVTEIDLTDVNEIFTCIKIYPNPADEFLFIDLPEPASVNLYDLHGTRVIQKSVITGRTQIVLSDLKPGLYIIDVVTANGKSLQQKIVVH